MLICPADEQRYLLGPSASGCRGAPATGGRILGYRPTVRRQHLLGTTVGCSMEARSHPFTARRPDRAAATHPRHGTAGTRGIRCREPRSHDRRVGHQVVLGEGVLGEPIGDGPRSRSGGTPVKKKTFVASEQDRPDVAEKREAFRQAILHLDAGRLVFIDETGSNLAMSPLYARARKGKRAYFKRPAARGSNISVIGALRLDGMLCFNAMDGALTGERFLLFLEHKLGPFLRASDVVILDNLRAHHVDGVRQLIESRGATLMYLPPYSPQMNPIEEAWSMFKAALRRASARTICDLVDALKAAMKEIGPMVATGFFKHAGYVQQT